MYWTLESRPPTVDEIMHHGAERIRAAVEAAIDRHDVSKLEIRCTEIYDEPQEMSDEDKQRIALARMAAQQDMNVRFGITASGQQVGIGGCNAFTGYGAGLRLGLGQVFGGIL